MAAYWGINMSVINQMLKDLDKRQSEQQGVSNVVVPVQAKMSVSKLLLIIVVVIIIFNVIGILGWKLYSENQQLRTQVDNAMVASKGQQSATDAPSNKASVVALALTEEPTTAISTVIQTFEEKAVLVQAEPEKALDNAALDNKNVPVNIVEKMTESQSPVDESAQVVVTALALSEPVVAKPEKVKEVVKPTSSLTISRTQLSPQALAENKISEAEQAIERNDIVKAESLFEEVLLVMPEHQTARKQLAALWYGKKSYQNAVNLLSQGIALAPQAEEMRIMSARIYFEQSQPRQAYDILKPLQHSVNTELQALLANTAAELNEHDNAILAYGKLIALEPHVGRWWLGSAVSLDSLGKFVPARDAYKQAIALSNLSISAMQFARQRLIELGE